MKVRSSGGETKLITTYINNMLRDNKVCVCVCVCVHASVEEEGYLSSRHHSAKACRLSLCCPAKTLLLSVFFF